ncbi:MAG: HD domain-containing protein [Proteobacteria bacterium]|nr:HD domain-containing protein [Pseudomonadota bacterium]
MRTGNGKHRQEVTAPPGSAEEILAAIEAATGESQETLLCDPMESGEIVEALDRLLIAPRPDRGFDALVRGGVMDALLPEVAALVGFGEGIRHKDVWNHTKKVVLQSPKRRVVRWAALLHDIGKVPTRRFEPDGQVTFLGHPEVGARMFEKVARRLSLPKPLKEPVRLLIASHLRAAAYHETWTDSAVRRFTRDMGESLEDLLDLSRADITSKHAEKVERGVHQINLLAERVATLREIDAKPKPLPKGLGTVIIDHFGIEPGPKLGNLMRLLMDEVEAGRLGVQEEHSHYLAFLEENPSLLETK